MKKIQRVINLFGYKSIAFDKKKNTEVKNNYSYESILIRRYAPWSDDEKFIKIYEKIKDFTLVDIYRLYELYTLAKQTADVEGAVIEVGAWRGGSCVVLAKAFLDIDTEIDFYCCDTFEGVANATEEDKQYKGGEHSDTSLQLVQNLFDDMGVGFIKILKGIFPEDTASLLKANKFRFCHIDVDVYKSAKQILEFVWPRLSTNGMVVFDDYGFISCNGVTKMVNELNLSDSIIIYNINGHAILVKKQ